jgi:hypothetical protein
MRSGLADISSMVIGPNKPGPLDWLVSGRYRSRWRSDLPMRRNATSPSNSPFSMSRVGAWRSDRDICCKCSRQLLAQTANSQRCSETVCCLGSSGPDQHGAATPAIDPEQTIGHLRPLRRSISLRTPHRPLRRAECPHATAIKKIWGLILLSPADSGLVS